MSSKSTPNDESSAAPERMNPVFSLPQSRSESGLPEAPSPMRHR
jgi:hypothetical protein